MNPGFISLLIIVISGILICTGWNAELLGGIRIRNVVLLGFGCLLCHRIAVAFPALEHTIVIRGDALVALAATRFCVRDGRTAGLAGYLLLCAFIVAMIWGSLREIYRADPVFYWLHPVWDAPLLSGMLAAAFTPKVKQQYAMLVWSAFLAEWISFALSGTSRSLSWGAFDWWDGLLISLAAARGTSLLFVWSRAAISRLAEGPWKRGEDGAAE